jgi:hypothetical protein
MQLVQHIIERLALDRLSDGSRGHYSHLDYSIGETLVSGDILGCLGHMQVVPGQQKALFRSANPG